MLAGLLAGAASSATPTGLWRSEAGYLYRWAPLAGGGLQEISLTVHRTPKNHCRVPAGTVVYRYHPLGGGTYLEDEFSWDSSCHASWDANAETVKLVVTATRLTLYCGEPFTEVCARYTRVDRTAPRVRALASTGRSGGATVLRYLVSDASGKTRETIAIYRGGTLLARYRTTLGPARAGRVYAYRLTRTPADLRGSLRFCVQSSDAAGNTSKASCATVTIG